MNSEVQLTSCDGMCSVQLTGRVGHSHTADLLQLITDTIQLPPHLDADDTQITSMLQVSRCIDEVAPGPDLLPARPLFRKKMWGP